MGSNQLDLVDLPVHLGMVSWGPGVVTECLKCKKHKNELSRLPWFKSLSWKDYSFA